MLDAWQVAYTALDESLPYHDGGVAHRVGGLAQDQRIAVAQVAATLALAEELRALRKGMNA